MAVVARPATWDTWSYKGEIAGERRNKLCVFIFRLLIAHTGWFGEAESSFWLLQKGPCGGLQNLLRPQTNSELWKRFGGRIYCTLRPNYRLLIISLIFVKINVTVNYGLFVMTDIVTKNVTMSAAPACHCCFVTDNYRFVTDKHCQQYRDFRCDITTEILTHL